MSYHDRDLPSSASGTTVDATDLEWETNEPGGRFAYRRKRLGITAGGDQLGCSLYEVPPGKSPWYYHFHEANEEAMYVLDGEGTLRTTEGEVPLSPDMYVAFPTGKEYAREVKNTSDQPLRVLMLSTMLYPDIVGYPDSEKYGIYSGVPPGWPDEQHTVLDWFHWNDSVGRWSGEL